MKTYAVPHSDLVVPGLILGLMRIAEMSDADIRQLFDTAVEAGITMVDHADIYGGAPHRSESRFGEAVQLSPSERAGILIQSKVGIRKGYFDFSSAHILKSVDESLAALRTDYLDILLLHRPDALVEPEEVASAFDALHTEGKVRHFGVSNHTPGQIELLKNAVRQPLLFNQVQLSLTHASLIAQGVAANMVGVEQSASRDVGLLDYSRLKGMMLQAWSPFHTGRGKGIFLGDTENHGELNALLEVMAAKYGVTPTGIAVAWIARHPANIQVVLGTTRPERVRDSAAGADVVLSREDWYQLFRAAGHTLP